MQRRVIERLYEDAAKTGNKLVIYTNIPESVSAEGISFWNFVVNPSESDNVVKYVTHIDFNVSGVKIQEFVPGNNCTYNNYIEYDTIVSVVEKIDK